MTTTPTTPEYHRRVIAPTAKAIQYGDRLADLMIEIHQTYTPLIAASIAAVESGNGFEVAEQIIADVEYMATPVTAWMTSAGIRNNGAFDGISEAVMGVAEYGLLDDAMDRCADQAAHPARLQE